MKSVLSDPFMRGIDTVQVLTRSALADLSAAGFDFVARYLFGRYAIKRQELRDILDAGFGFMPIVPSAAPGWIPSGKLGHEVAVKTLDALDHLQLPTVTTWLDNEGSGGTSEQTGEWINAWSYSMRHQQIEAGLYVGAGAVLDAGELYRLPYVTRYWRSCSRVPEPSVRGFCMSQLRPGNARISNVVVDVNVIERDFKGDLPQMVVA